MSSESTMSPLLAFGALGVVFAALLLLVALEARVWPRLQAFLFDHTQKLILLVAGSAMAGSLYYSEVVGFEPCEFCWFQRIAMYPLAVLLAVALVSRRRFEPRYIVTLASIGLALSIYHYQLQVFPNQAKICSSAVPCSGRYVNEMGFVTIPFMAGCAFLVVLVLQFIEWRADRLFRGADAASTDHAGRTAANLETSGA